MKVYGMVIQIAEGPRFPHRFAFTWSCSLSPGPSDPRAVSLTPALCYLLKKNEDRILTDALYMDTRIDKEVLII